MGRKPDYPLADAKCPTQLLQCRPGAEHRLAQRVDVPAVELQGQSRQIYAAGRLPSAPVLLQVSTCHRDPFWCVNLRKRILLQPPRQARTIGHLLQRRGQANQLLQASQAVERVMLRGKLVEPFRYFRSKGIAVWVLEVVNRLPINFCRQDFRKCPHAEPPDDTHALADCDVGVDRIEPETGRDFHPLRSGVSAGRNPAIPIAAEGRDISLHVAHTQSLQFIIRGQ